MLTVRPFPSLICYQTYGHDILKTSDSELILMSIGTSCPRDKRIKRSALRSEGPG